MLKTLKNERGVALLMAILMITLIIYLVTEVSYESNVEYAINSQSINQLKAHYAARSGVELSLLRIKLFQKVSAQFGEQLGSNSAMLNMLWSFPFAWPPVAPPDMNAVDVDSFKKISKASTMDAQFLATISDEGSKLDINDLASPSKLMRERTKQQLENIFKSRLEQDDDWAKENRDLPYQEVINNLIDWVDADQESLNGGDERSYYAKVFEQDKDSEPQLPPNRHFITLQEIRMVPGITDELWKLLEPSITVFGQKGINPNHAPKEVLMSLDPSINEEIAQAIMARRDNPKEGGPFQEESEFIGFVQGKGGRLDSNSTYVPLVFNPPYNFKIKSSGQFANSAVEIEVLVADVASTEKRLSTLIIDQEKKEAQEAGAISEGESNDKDGSKKSKTTKAVLPKGRPRIIYWSER